MKTAKTLIESLSDMEEVATQGDLRRIVANSLLALARKEVSATDVEAMAKGLDSISNSLNAEIRVAKAKIELREHGGDIGKLVHMGQMLIGNPPKQDSGGELTEN